MEEQILMEDTIDLRELYQAVKRKAWLICLLVAIAVTASGIISYFVIEPVYQAELTFMVNFNQNEDEKITKEDIEYGENLVEKYKPIIKSRKVSSQIKKNLGLKMTQEEISNAIEITSISGPVLSVKVNNTNPTIARDIANEVPDIFAKELKRIAKVDGLEVIDDAITPTSPIKPNKMMNIAISAVLAVMIGLFIIFLMEALDNKIKKPEDIEKCIGIPVLGTIYEYETNNKNNKKKSKKKIA